MLKTMILSAVLIISAISIIGCTKACPEPRIVVKYKYLDRPIVSLKNKPKFMKYRIDRVSFNGKDFYFMTINDGNIMLANWLVYKDWAETNYNTLKNLDVNNTSRVGGRNE